MKTRVMTTLQKFAHLIGGTDEKGVKHVKSPAEQREHMFWVKNKDLPNPVGNPVLGHLVEGKVIEDCYSVEYLGKHSEYKTNKKLLKLNLEQAEEIINGQKAKDERKGVFRGDEYYQEKLKAEKAAIQDAFDSQA